MPQRIEILDDETLAFTNHADTEELHRVQDECARIKAVTNSKGDVTRVASVPVEMVQRYCDLKGITYADFMRSNEHDKEFLNSPEIQAFRTWEGRL